MFTCRVAFDLMCEELGFNRKNRKISEYGEHLQKATEKLEEHGSFKFLPNLAKCIALGKLDLSG
jgi:hypothetical protein